MRQAKTPDESSPELVSPTGARPSPAAAVLSDEQIQRQVNLILESRHFRQARSLEKFLNYVIAKTLAGAQNELKEYSIGLEVFQRGPDYDPRRDAVVRVQANVLRKRLAAYYQEEGVADPILIELPKGHYVPHCYLRAEQPAVAENREDVTELKPFHESNVSEDLSRPARIRSRRWVSFSLVAATFLAGLLTAFGFDRWQGGRRPAGASPQTASIDPAFLPLWGKFLEPGVENLLAFGTPQFFSSDGVYVRDVKINSPQEADEDLRMISLRKSSQLDLKPIEIYTGVGETHGVYLLTRFFGKTTSDLRVTRSRMLGWNELKNSNVIFLSSMRFHTLAKELPYPSDFAIHSGIDSTVINLRPAAGEQMQYGGAGAGEFAVVTIWPGKLNQRRIMELSGSTTWATLGAAEYVTDPDYLRQLNQHLEQCRLKSNAAEHAPYFQVVLRTEVKDNQPVSINYVTHHDLQIDDPAEKPVTAKQVAAHRR